MTDRSNDKVMFARFIPDMGSMSFRSHGSMGGLLKDEDWRVVDGKDYELNLNKITHLLVDDNLQVIKHDQIAWRGMDLPPEYLGEKCYCCEGERYYYCDVEIPPIVSISRNPHNLKYRLIDGKHRLYKRSKQYGATESEFYVLNIEDLIPLMTRVFPKLKIDFYS